VSPTNTDHDPCHWRDWCLPAERCGHSAVFTAESWEQWHCMLEEPRPGRAHVTRTNRSRLSRPVLQSQKPNFCFPRAPLHNLISPFVSCFRCAPGWFSFFFFSVCWLRELHVNLQLHSANGETNKRKNCCSENLRPGLLVIRYTHTKWRKGTESLGNYSF
jgi:hypothetical protein